MGVVRFIEESEAAVHISWIQSWKSGKAVRVPRRPDIQSFPGAPHNCHSNHLDWDLSIYPGFLEEKGLFACERSKNIDHAMCSLQNKLSLIEFNIL